MNYNNLKNQNINSDTCFKDGACPKSGIKIHEHNVGRREDPNQRQQDPNQRQQDIFRPSAVKTPVNFYETSLNNLDLDLEHYSLEDLYKLFNIPGHLTSETLGNAKQIVYKMHPDKSRLDPKYFRFFSAAYKRVYSIFEFQNKSLNKRPTGKDDDFYDESNKTALNNMFEQNKGLKDPKNFNSWFNDKFEKHQGDDVEGDASNKGYGDWLKSDEGLYSVNDNVTKANMNDAFEKQKRQVQSLTTYQGISDSFSSFSGSLLGEQSDNFTGSNGGLSFMDLRQAHVESVIPITQEDYDRMPKYKSLSEYKAKRDNIDTNPLSKQESERMLLSQGENLERQSAALAYKYAQQSEKSRQNNQSFFSDLRQLKG